MTALSTAPSTLPDAIRDTGRGDQHATARHRGRAIPWRSFRARRLYPFATHRIMDRERQETKQGRLQRH